MSIHYGGDSKTDGSSSTHLGGFLGAISFAITVIRLTAVQLLQGQLSLLRFAFTIMDAKWVTLQLTCIRNDRVIIYRL